jgi:hypothetical protein
MKFFTYHLYGTLFQKKCIMVFLLTAFFIFSRLSTAHSQNLFIYFMDGSQASYNLLDIRNLSISEFSNSMQINKFDGSNVTWDLSIVKFYNYKNQPSGVINAKNTVELTLYPNPVNDIVNINYELTNNENVSIVVYDSEGKIVKFWEQGSNLSGNQTLTWNTATMKSGIYFVQLSTTKGTLTQKMIIQ